MDARSFLGGVFASFFIFLLYFFSNSFVSDESCSVQTVFSPYSEGEIVNIVREAKENISLEMYVFTSERIARELGDAAARGVSVRVILEQRTNSYNLKKIVAALLDSGVEVRWATFDYKLTHTKMMVIDGKRVFVGSTNFSNSALGENREMAVLLEGEIVSEFVEAFEKDWGKGSLAE